MSEESNKIEYKGINIGRRDLFETVTYQNAYWVLEYSKYKIDTTDYLFSVNRPQTLCTLQMFLEFLYVEKSDMNIIDVTEKEAEEFVYFSAQRRSIDTTAAIIYAFYDYLIVKDVVKKNPFTNAKKLVYSLLASQKEKKMNKSSKNFVTDEHIEQIMASPDLQLKTYAIFSLSSGAKRKEICDLKWEQIDFEKRIAKIENNNLYFSERASNLLKELKNERKAKELIGFDNDAGYVFRSAYSAKMFSKKSPISTSTLETWGGLIGRLIDIPNFSHGDFRYTAISSFLSKSGSVGMASVIFNYPSLSSNVDKFIRNEESNDILQEYKDICEI